MTATPDPHAYGGPRRILSGIQASGSLHLGNYLGALKRFVPLQDEAATFVFVADLHAVTAPQDPALLAAQTREIAAAYIASGLDPRRTTIWPQSAVPGHAELAWILQCVARVGWLDRMTQFKDKSGRDKEGASVGLYTYPVLQAADILLYRATDVPVGEDQKQHLELTRDIAHKFNTDFAAPGFFPLPEPLIEGPAPRVMSLRDGTAKMSKSTRRTSRASTSWTTPTPSPGSSSAPRATPRCCRIPGRSWRAGRRRSTSSASTPPWPTSPAPRRWRASPDAASAHSSRSWRRWPSPPWLPSPPACASSWTTRRVWTPSCATAPSAPAPWPSR